jgi:hypothetical protein
VRYLGSGSEEKEARLSVAHAPPPAHNTRPLQPRHEDSILSTIDNLQIKEYLAARTHRKSADNLAKELAKHEEFLLGEIQKQVSAGDTHPQVEQITKQKPVVLNWSGIWAYIKANDAFELVHKRISEAAATERLLSGENIEGLTLESVTTIKINEA